MKTVILILLTSLVVSVSNAGTCSDLSIISDGESNLTVKAMQISNNVTLESTTEFQDVYQAYYRLLERSMMAKAVGSEQEFANQLNLCLSPTLANSTANPRQLAQVLISKIEGNPALKQHFKKVFSDDSYERFITSLRKAETVDHVLRSFMGLGIAGPAALVMFAAILSEGPVIVITVSIVAMVGGVGYIGKQIYDANKISIKKLFLSSGEREQIKRQAAQTAAEATRNIVKNGRLSMSSIQTLQP